MPLYACMSNRWRVHVTQVILSNNWISFNILKHISFTLMVIQIGSVSTAVVVSAKHSPRQVVWLVEKLFGCWSVVSVHLCLHIKTIVTNNFRKVRNNESVQKINNFRADLEQFFLNFKPVFFHKSNLFVIFRFLVLNLQYRVDEDNKLSKVINMIWY